MNKSITSILDLDSVSINKIFKNIKKFKKNKTINKYKGKTIGLLFEKFSTRTRLSFESAIAKLGAYPIFINKSDTQLSRGESIFETARMFSLYLDGLVYRTDSHNKLLDFNSKATIPVINALSEFEHPTQILSDLFTMKEHFNNKSLKSLKIAYVGDSNNISNSFALAVKVLDLNIFFCCPDEYNKSLKKINKDFKKLKISNNIMKSTKDVDVIYTDVWTSMGMEKENRKRLKAFKNFQISKDIINNANKKVIFMHCLPAHIGEEVTEEVLNSENSIIYKQAENKLYTAMALIDYILSS
tara:strand:- start:1027 stop:1923 length:897 start_codon:yes stop_codon:yes gene_type:complete